MAHSYSDGTETFLLNENLLALREQNRFDGNLFMVNRELRTRRKNFLGSHFSLRSLVYDDNGFNYSAVVELSRYLSKRTAHFWNLDHSEAETFCFRFYVLAITAITHELIAQECVDDILQFAHCLTGSKQTFSVVMKDMLPTNFDNELQEFLSDYPDSFYNSTFEDGVLGAVCVLLGVIDDPVTAERSGQVEEN